MYNLLYDPFDTFGKLSIALSNVECATALRVMLNGVEA